MLTTCFNLENLKQKHRLRNNPVFYSKDLPSIYSLFLIMSNLSRYQVRRKYYEGLTICFSFLRKNDKNEKIAIFLKSCI